MGKSVDNENRMSVEEAARWLGMGRESLCECMRQDAFPSQIGIAIKKPGNKNYTYIIYRRKVEALAAFWGLTD